jgi:hypothetical protein
VAVGPPLSATTERLETGTAPTVRTAPLDDLVPGIGDELGALPDPWGVAVYLPGRGRMYAWNGFEPFPMASVAKVVIALAFLDGLSAAGAEPSPEEVALLRAMLTASDNDAADALFRRIGGADGAKAFLDAHLVAGISFVPGSLAWGDGTASAVALAQLLDLLNDEAFLTPGQRLLVKALMAEVVDGQRWGMSAAFPAGERGPVYGIKNGWFPGENGWWVASVALSVDPAVEPAVVVALSHGPASLDEAIAEIERLAARIRVAVYESELLETPLRPVMETQAYVFSPTPLGLPSMSGECEPSVALAGRRGAYACRFGGETIDPCFAAPPGASSVAVCRARPGDRGGAAAVPVAGIQHARTLEEVRSRQRPWFIELEDRGGCEVAGQAAREAYQGPGEPTYACSDGRFVVGPLTEGDVWRASVYDPRIQLAFEVRVATLWY